MGVMKAISTRRINDPDLEGNDPESRVMRLLWLQEKNRNKPDTWESEVKVISPPRDGWKQERMF